MANRVIANCIREKIENLNMGNDAIVVLKGIPLSIVDETVERIDLSNVVANKMGYFMSIFERRRLIHPLGHT